MENNDKKKKNLPKNRLKRKQQKRQKLKKQPSKKGFQNKKRSENGSLFLSFSHFFIDKPFRIWQTPEKEQLFIRR